MEKVPSTSAAGWGQVNWRRCVAVVELGWCRCALASQPIPWLQPVANIASIKTVLRVLRIPCYKESHLWKGCSYICANRNKTGLTLVLAMYELRHFSFGQSKEICWSSCSSEICYSPSKLVLSSIRICHLTENLFFGGHKIVSCAN